MTPIKTEPGLETPVKSNACYISRKVFRENAVNYTPDTIACPSALNPQPLSTEKLDFQVNIGVSKSSKATYDGNNVVSFPRDNSVAEAQSSKLSDIIDKPQASFSANSSGSILDRPFEFRDALQRIEPVPSHHEDYFSSVPSSGRSSSNQGAFGEAEKLRTNNSGTSPQLLPPLWSGDTNPGKDKSFEMDITALIGV